jgi:hypothetical protein
MNKESIMNKVMLSFLVLFASQLAAGKSSLICSIEGLACMKGSAKRITQETCTYITDSCMDKSDNGNRANLNFPFLSSKLNCELRTLSCLKGATNISAENACGIINRLCIDNLDQVGISSQSDVAPAIKPSRGNAEVDRGAPAGEMPIYSLSDHRKTVTVNTLDHCADNITGNTCQLPYGLSISCDSDLDKMKFDIARGVYCESLESGLTIRSVYHPMRDYFVHFEVKHRTADTVTGSLTGLPNLFEYTQHNERKERMFMALITIDVDYRRTLKDLNPDFSNIGQFLLYEYVLAELNNLKKEVKMSDAHYIDNFMKALVEGMRIANAKSNNEFTNSLFGTKFNKNALHLIELGNDLDQVLKDYSHVDRLKPFINNINEFLIELNWRYD